MKAIACTPNQCADDELYQKGVIEPTRRIRQLQEELGDRPPSEEQMRLALDLLLQIFETKQVDGTERKERFEEILSKSDVQETFRELVPRDS